MTIPTETLTVTIFLSVHPLENDTKILEVHRPDTLPSSAAYMNEFPALIRRQVDTTTFLYTNTTRHR
jgi:hypothetical protein